MSSGSQIRRRAEIFEQEEREREEEEIRIGNTSNTVSDVTIWTGTHHE